MASTSCSCSFSWFGKCFQRTWWARLRNLSYLPDLASHVWWHVHASDDSILAQFLHLEIPAHIARQAAALFLTDLNAALDWACTSERRHNRPRPTLRSEARREGVVDVDPPSPPHLPDASSVRFAQPPGSWGASACGFKGSEVLGPGAGKTHKPLQIHFTILRYQPPLLCPYLVWLKGCLRASLRCFLDISQILASLLETCLWRS